LVPQLEQNRLSSGTTGFCITAVAASIAGIGGMTVRPAPRRAERIRWLDDPTRRVALVPVWRARAEPIAVEDNRLLATERVEPIGDGSAADSAGSLSAAVPQTSQ
jgi:hypothetical protein